MKVFVVRIDDDADLSVATLDRFEDTVFIVPAKDNLAAVAKVELAVPTIRNKVSAISAENFFSGNVVTEIQIGEVWA